MTACPASMRKIEGWSRSGTTCASEYTEREREACEGVWIARVGAAWRRAQRRRSAPGMSVMAVAVAAGGCIERLDVAS